MVREAKHYAYENENKNRMLNVTAPLPLTENVDDWWASKDAYFQSRWEHIVEQISKDAVTPDQEQNLYVIFSDEPNDIMKLTSVVHLTGFIEDNYPGMIVEFVRPDQMNYYVGDDDPVKATVIKGREVDFEVKVQYSVRGE